MHVALVKMPYTGARNVPELSEGPDYVDGEDLLEAIRAAGAVAGTPTRVRLEPSQETASGRWHRMGLACGNLAALVAAETRRSRFVVGLLGNCTSLLGMLAGLRRTVKAASGAPTPSVGMLFLDAHGDFNTPETTLSGMLGGMPVAVAAGLCLHRLRREAGLDPPVPPASIVLGGLRDVDPQERQLIDEQGVEVLSVDDLRPGSAALAGALGRLASTVDAVYVHVDLDVLDAAEVPGHWTPVPGGPGSVELAETLREITARREVAAVGIASTPPGGRDEGGAARRAAHRLIAAAVSGGVSRRR